MKKNQNLQIKTIWFDLGNVILFFDMGVAFRKLLPYTGFSLADIKRYFARHSEIEAEVDCGRIRARDLYRKLKRDLKLRGLSFKRFKDIWNNIFCRNKETIAIIKKLKRNGYRLVLISNTNRLHYDFIKERYRVVDYFDRHILSFRLKVRKPKAEIYLKALLVSRAKPGEIFYTDDRSELIRQAARKHGVHAHIFRSAAGLRRELLKKGVNLN